MLGLGLSFTRVAVSARKALLAILHITGSKGLVFDKAGGVLVNGRTSTATVKDYQGNVITLPAGCIRFTGARYVNHADNNTYNTGLSTGWEALDTDTNGILLTPKPEILSEGLRTNLLPYSEDFNNAIWSKTQSTVGLSNNRNGITTQQLIDTTANNQHRFSKGLNITAGVDYTLSVYLKKINNRYAVLWLYGLTTGTTLARCFFDLQTGTIANLQFGTASIEDIGNGLFRCSVTANSGTNAQVLDIIQSTQNSITLSYAGTAIPVLEAGGAQLEQSSDLTSYIPTTTAAVTRSADYINLPLVSGVNFNPSEGVLLFKYKPDYNLSAYSGHLFEVSTAIGALLYDHSTPGSVATYDGVAGRVKDIGTANKNNTYLFSVIWSQSLNSFGINVSTDNGVTWSVWASGVFSGAFQIGSLIGIFTGLNRTALLDAVILYDALPKPSVAETQTWVENNAGGLTS